MNRITLTFACLFVLSVGIGISIEDAHSQMPPPMAGPTPVAGLTPMATPTPPPVTTGTPGTPNCYTGLPLEISHRRTLPGSAIWMDSPAYKYYVCRHEFDEMMADLQEDKDGCHFIGGNYVQVTAPNLSLTYYGGMYPDGLIFECIAHTMGIYLVKC